MTRDEMPPLPEKSFLGDCVTHGYDEEDMRTYAARVAERARTDEREALAQAASNKARAVEKANTHRGRVNSAAQFAAGLLDELAAAIRARP